MIHPFDKRVIGLVIYTVSLALAVTGHAQKAAPGTNEAAEDTTADAAAAFWKGKESYEQGDYGKAREQFEAAYRQTKDPDLLYDIGQTYRQQADCSNAKETYERFLEAAPDSPHAPQAKQYLAALEPTCRKPPSPKLDVLTTPTSPRPTVGAPPRPPDQRGGPVTPATAMSPADRTRRFLALTTLAVGAIAGGTAAGIAVWNHGRYDQWKEKDGDLAKGTGAQESPAQWAQRQGSNDRFGAEITHTNRAVLYLSLGAAASVIASGVLFFLPSDSTSGPTATRKPFVDFSCTPTVVGTRTYNLSLRSSF
jgi:tetratricopeptide (TPR) repeat protein